MYNRWENSAMRKAFFLFLLCGPVYAGGSYQFLQPAQLAALKKKPCTLIHAWAAWCGICVREMPAYIEFLSQNKKIHPVTLDVGSKTDQNAVSRQWPLLRSAQFTKYMKPEKISDQKYLAAIDPKWSGSLPYTVLYHKGMKRREWVGSLDFSTLGREVQQTCE